MNGAAGLDFNTQLLQFEPDRLDLSAISWGRPAFCPTGQIIRSCGTEAQALDSRSSVRREPAVQSGWRDLECPLDHNDVVLRVHAYLLVGDRCQPSVARSTVRRHYSCRSQKSDCLEIVRFRPMCSLRRRLGSRREGSTILFGLKAHSSVNDAEKEYCNHPPQNVEMGCHENRKAFYSPQIDRPPACLIFGIQWESEPQRTVYGCQ